MHCYKAEEVVASGVVGFGRAEQKSISTSLTDFALTALWDAYSLFLVRVQAAPLLGL